MIAQMAGQLDWAGSLIDLATATGFAGLVWYLVVKHIPAIEQRHQSERSEWLEYITRRDQEFDALTREYLKSVSDIKQELRDLNAKVG